jgi:O-antigen ligase
LLFLLAGLLSIPLAMSPVDAWETYTSTFVRCIIIFIVMVNVARTKARLMGLLFLALFVGLWLSVGAINDYRLGLAVVEGYRAGGRGSGIFGNSNEMALHLVTIVPIVVALVFATRSIVWKCAYSLSAVLMVAGIVVSYSRGAFVGLLVASALLVWKLGQRQRLIIGILTVITIGLFLLLVPGNYGTRILSIFVPSLDPVGSSEARRAELLRSLNVSLHHPLFGIGMGNYASQMSLRDVVTHNSYTQVSAEMGVAALVCYTMLVVTPFRRLGEIARETFATRSSSQYFYLAVGLQASLGAYLVASFFASVAYYWYVYYLVGYAVCFRRIYESDTSQVVFSTTEKIKQRDRSQGQVSFVADMET